MNFWKFCIKYEKIQFFFRKFHILWPTTQKSTLRSQNSKISCLDPISAPSGHLWISKNSKFAWSKFKKISYPTCTTSKHSLRTSGTLVSQPSLWNKINRPWNFYLFSFGTTSSLLSHTRSCKRSRTLFKSLPFWLAGEASWLAVEVLSPWHLDATLLWKMKVTISKTKFLSFFKSLVICVYITQICLRTL